MTSPLLVVSKTQLGRVDRTEHVVGTLSRLEVATVEGLEIRIDARI